MSSDIEKLAVFDGRIVQSRPKYAVEKGALSVTNAPFRAISASTSQHSYNIYVPSENVYVDRAVEWSSTVAMQFTATQTAAVAPTFPSVLAQAGRDFALCAFPLNSLCSTLTATINDTTTVINSQDVLKEVLRLTDYKKNRAQRTCPTMLDKYYSYDDAFGAINNPLAGFENQTDVSETPNGAFYNLLYTLPNGTTPLPNLVVAGVPTYAPAFAGANYTAIAGLPVAPPAWAANPPIAWAAGMLAASGGRIWLAVAPDQVTAPVAPAWTDVGSQTVQTIYVQWTSTEKLVLSPFVFSDCHEWDTGLFGINNIQLIMNLQTSPARVLRSTTRAGVTLSQIGYAQASQNPFTNSVVNVQFLTPSLDVPLPPKSVVPYMEFPRYITAASQQFAPGQVQTIQSQTITLPQIPDLFIIYVKPQAYTVDGTPGGVVDSTQGDWYLPVASRADAVTNPLTVNFDNFSGLLSSVTTEQLYGMSVHNGLDMDYNQWVGQAHSMAGGLGAAPPVDVQLGAGRMPLSGGILVLKPSQDITLQTGQAPSLVNSCECAYQQVCAY